MRRDGLSRRAFFRKGSALAAGIVAGVLGSEGCAPRAYAQSASSTGSSLKVVSRNPRMGYRKLGRTSLMVSEIVLGSDRRYSGAGHFRKQFVDGKVPTDVLTNRTDVVSKCIDHGINYLDITCAPEAIAYGAALKGRRDRMLIAADDVEYAMRQDRSRNTEGQMKSIESCLRKLGTDRLDVWRPQFKPMGGHRDVDLELCVTVFEKARSQGKVRFLGMSTQDRGWIQHIIERFPQYTVFYVPFAAEPSATPRSSESSDSSESGEARDSRWWLADASWRRLFEAARAHDVGVIMVAPFGPETLSARAADRPDETSPELAPSTLPHILSNPDVSAVAVDMRLPGHVDSYVQAFSDRQAML